MLENKIEQKLRQEVERIGGKAYKLESQGNAGMPDRLVCLSQGRVVFVETKKPKGGRLSKLQQFRISELNGMGFDARVINTYEQIQEFIAEVTNGI